MSVVFSFDATFKLRHSSELVIKYRYHTGTNALAYLASSSAAKEKSFIRLTPGVNVIKRFSFVDDDEA